MKDKLIECLNDTINNINNNPLLLINTKKAIGSTQLYYPENKDIINFANKNTKVDVVEDTTFHCAQDLVKKYPKVAVLNFASAVNPGGGVTIGAMAQEECLCRSSNLFLCLKSKKLMDEYYLFHRKLNNNMYTDRIIYSKNVTVLKTDDLIPQLMSEQNWFNVDVITCAAPNLNNQNYNVLKLKKILECRVKRIFQVAIENGVEAIVLGAFGCGAFKNPPLLMAQVFRNVLFNENYKNGFKKVVFAIKHSEKNNANFDTFKQVLVDEVNGNIKFDIPYDILKKGVSLEEFKDWQKNNELYGKNISVLGDSISTLCGYIPYENEVFYANRNCEIANIQNQNDTWWGKIIGFLGAKLLVNNSWSGCRVVGDTIASGCSENRTSNLHIGSIKPDVILIYLGFNDWANGIGMSISNAVNDHTNNFQIAYDKMINNIKTSYPSAKIYCSTICTTYMSANSNFNFPFENGGVHIEKYNNVIKEVANKNNCKILDLYSINCPYDSIDGSHPNVDGMRTLSKLMAYVISGKNDNFIEIPNKTLSKSYAEPIGNEQNVYCSNCGKFLQTNSNFCIYCGKKIQSSEIEPNFKTNNGEDLQDAYIDIRYKLIKKIGKGGSSKVYLANDEKIDRLCAVKIVSKNGYVNKIASQMLFEEANKMKLLHHIGIPQLYDILDEQERLCIVMEYIEGRTLEEILQTTKKPLEEKLVVDWAIQLCKILEYLHTLNPPRIFRDVKPANIILQPNGNIKLFDFGIMRIYDSNKETDTCNLGTKGFAPPEQVSSRCQSDQRTDIYALGITMHYLLTGINPTKMVGEILPITTYRPELSNELDDIIKKCTEMNPDNRYQSCFELENNLSEFKNGNYS